MRRAASWLVCHRTLAETEKTANGRKSIGVAGAARTQQLMEPSERFRVLFRNTRVIDFVFHNKRQTPVKFIIRNVRVPLAGGISKKKTYIKKKLNIFL